MYNAVALNVSTMFCNLLHPKLESSSASLPYRFQICQIHNCISQFLEIILCVCVCVCECVCVCVPFWFCLSGEPELMHLFTGFMALCSPAMPCASCFLVPVIPLCNFLLCPAIPLFRTKTVFKNFLSATHKMPVIVEALNDFDEWWKGFNFFYKGSSFQAVSEAVGVNKGKFRRNWSFCPH